ncbi:Ulp1 protease family, carboxy-terminal domain protein [Spatholobus suberectus]|nr:Ulp1 protease family, carboxy-terminal domain protein [Spatholobus suberectus]
MVSETKKKANQKKSPDLPPQKTCTRNKKASKVKQVIEISSSYIESIPKPDSYEHNSPKSLLVSHIISKEIIVTTTEKTISDRDTLRTLLPKGLVDQEVLNLLANMLTAEERSISQLAGFWFLPTTVAQYALSWVTRLETVMEYYQHQYMGKIDYLSKIYVPINDMSCHWYLLVVDIHEKRLVLLDSKPHPQRNVARRRNVRKLAIFLEELLLHKSFYQFPFTSKPEISEFLLVVPNDIGEQLLDSNDCGIWVAKWMIDPALSNDYKIHVDNGTRMKIALDLVLGSHNTNRDEIIKLAATNWKNLEAKKKRLVVSSLVS